MKSIKPPATNPSANHIDQVIAETYEVVRLATGGTVRPWNIRKCARSLQSQILKLRQVKTLWQVDKAVDLKEFYCDSHIVIGKERILIVGVADLGNRKRVIITGIAGQGKSILLRYLCSAALLKEDYLPIFVELRRILPNETLTQHITRFLEDSGVSDINEQLLKVLLGSGKVALFLDGFDEVAESDKPRILNEIERLASSYEQLRIIVTSRPQSGIEVSPLLEVIKLSDLAKGEYRNVIKKLSDDHSFADSLIRQVEAHKSKLADLLCTPLLVTLLVMSYKSFQELPDQLSEFYDSIFQVLLQRHDGAKPSFKRPRKCPINDNEYRSVFESMCFESKRKVKSIFDYDEVSGFAKAALKMNYLKADADKYLDDIVKVTCLILTEGKDYRFIHKSVQEYYAAAFIKHRPEPVAIKFYQMVLRPDLRANWRQELHFLSEVDRYRYNKFYYLPYLCSVIGLDPSALPKECPITNANQTTQLLGEFRLAFNAMNPDEIRLVSISSRNEFLATFHIDIFKLNFSSVKTAIKERTLQPDSTPTNQPWPPSPWLQYSAKRIMEAGLMNVEFAGVAQRLVSKIFTLAHKTKEAIFKEDSIDLQL